MRTLRFALTLVLLLAAAAVGHAATIVIVNNDGAGEGFNDPSPRAPVGGNPGVTLGEQRLNIFNHAASIWGALLPSAVTIQVRAQFNPQTCSATSAVLGSAGAITIHRDFAGAEFSGTWYGQALANKQFGADLSAVQPDINATFNSQLDAGCFGPGLVWYYGLDGLEGVNIELLPVVLHELGHGLNFQQFGNLGTGAPNAGFPDIYQRYMFDETVGLYWPDMTNAQRQASAVNSGNVAWDGFNVNTMAQTFLNKRPRMIVNSPGAIAGEYPVGVAAFGASLTQAGISGNVVLVDDGVSTAPTGTPSDGCETPYINAAAVAGNIALLDRGSCTFVIKAAAAQAAGAVALIIANNAAGLIDPGGTDPMITIPVVMITQAAGTAMKAELLNGPVNVTLNRHPTLLAGTTDAGRVRLFAPNPVQGGSSISHFDTALDPNALMEPSATASLHDNVDLTLELFRDIGWFFGATATAMSMFAGGEVDGGYELRWQIDDGLAVDGFRVYRGTIEDGVYDDLAGMLPAAARSWRDSPGAGVWYYRIEGIRDGAVVADAGPYRAEVSGGVASVEFAHPSPNPSAGDVHFDWAIPADLSGSSVELAIFDIGGRRVDTVFKGAATSGRHVTTWSGRRADGGAVGNGVYFARLTTRRGVESRRIMIAR